MPEGTEEVIELKRKAKELGEQASNFELGIEIPSEKKLLFLNKNLVMIIYRFFHLSRGPESALGILTRKCRTSCII